ncbi:MAG: 16S rRNA (guanine(966)-N(2))-methyltransferase RsmD [Verrucomicrobiota bacterium]
MRIIGGQAAGRLLKVPKGFEVRPTPDLVKQAIFNSLGERVLHAAVLELFAGSGALGLECLSRGAREVISVEKAPRHARAIRENLQSLGLPSASFHLRVEDAFVALDQLARHQHSFDLILADPPFGEKNVGRRSTSFSQQLLDHAALPGLVRSGGLLVLGHTKRDELTVPPAWDERKQLRHGDSSFRFLAPNSPGS